MAAYNSMTGQGWVFIISDNAAEILKNAKELSTVMLAALFSRILLLQKKVPLLQRSFRDRQVCSWILLKPSDFKKIPVR